MTSKGKLRPAIGDLWDFHYSATQVSHYALTSKRGDYWWGTSNDSRGREMCFETESKMLSDDRFVLVRPAGCPEGFVACTDRCGRWTREDASHGVVCWTCAADEVCIPESKKDWTPPADRVLAQPGGFSPVAAVDLPSAAPPAVLTGDVSAPPIRIPRLDEFEERLRRVEAGFQGQDRVNAQAGVCLAGFERRLEDVESRLGGCERESNSQMRVNDTILAALKKHEARLDRSSISLRACGARGPQDSRCLRDAHRDDEHRFGVPVGVVD